MFNRPQRATNFDNINTMKKIATITATIAIALTFTACGSSGGEVTESGTSDAAAQSEETTPTKEATAEEKPENPTFGDTYTWDNGLAVTISEPETYEPSEYAAGTVEGQDNVTLEITVTNDTTEDVESSMFMITVSSGGSEASEIFDTEGGIEFPTSTILPGKSLTWNVAYSVADTNDIQVTFDNVIDFEAEKVHFTSN